VKQVLSPKELALAIGASESSVKRWVDDGVVQAERTAGGHRRISRQEAIRFIRRSGFAVARADLLGLPAEVALTHSGAESIDERLFSLLSRGAGREARSLILGRYLEGADVAEIADGPIRGAMDRLGELWQHSADGIFIEHRATDICVMAINQLRAFIEVPDNAPAAVGGAPEGDLYTLPSLIASAALAGECIRAINLGPQTPIDSLLRAARHHEARLIWLSVSTAANHRRLAADVADLAARAGDAGVSVVLGGRGVRALRLPRTANLHVGASMRELIAFARGLGLAQPAPGPSSADSARLDAQPHSAAIAAARD